MASVRIPIQDIDVRPKWFQMQAVEVRCLPPMLKLMPVLQNDDNRSGGAKGEDSMVPSMHPPQPRSDGSSFLTSRIVTLLLALTASLSILRNAAAVGRNAEVRAWGATTTQDCVSDPVACSLLCLSSNHITRLLLQTR